MSGEEKRRRPAPSATPWDGAGDGEFSVALRTGVLQPDGRIRQNIPGLYHFQRDFLFHAVCQTDGGFWCEVDQLGNRLRGFSLGATFQIFSHGNQG